MKLQGLRVIDLSAFLPGPYLTLALADHGAEVIKVEPPGEGDPGRAIGPRDGDASVFFRTVNRGKKSIVLDLKSPDGQVALQALCRGADVFVESNRPGVMRRLGADYDTLAALNPRLVYCSISAFGQTGPYRDRPAHDLAVEALAGPVGITLGADGAPAIPGIAAADMLSALHGLSAVLMALYRREQTGRGDYIDLAMHDAALGACPNQLGPVFAARRAPVPAEERTLGGSAFYRLYRTSDGRHVALGGQEIKFVRTLLDALGRPDLVALCARGPGLHQRPAIDFLERVFAERSQAQWVDWFRGRDVCFAPVKDLREAFDDAQARERGMVITDEAGREHLAPVIKFRDEPARPRLAAPALGQHTAEILAGLPASADALVGSGASGCAAPANARVTAPVPAPGTPRSSRGP
jgi:crotonobetainyl-CoA:carnitine CoA-transferase CaiB-like acyl-CoA transferase